MPSTIVAMVLVPTSEAALRCLPFGTPVWVASVPEMQSTLASAKLAGLAVTELFPTGESPTQWLFNSLDSVDQHHNEHSQPSPYTKLLVFGVSPSSTLAPLLEEFGFRAPIPEPYGFSALRLLATRGNE